MLITRRLEFDAGHRISTHNSQCRHLHGHRYVIEITLSGNIISDEGVAEQGMVMDFSEIKRIAKEVLVDKWDHAFLVYARDTLVVEFLQSLKDHKTVIIDTQPTAENLAIKAFHILDLAFQDAYGNRLALEQVRLYETPNCWADARREIINHTNNP
ncbi:MULTISPECIES: 6-carboxytetrahydropterin synthase QueD [Nitrosomonas]|uniref:6-carboxy-5,6,7,8-tetrahydropterin synthase n=1 Tax=Nitrosomonas communis TaxID=44574 RepID=A0A0F7KH65_9PROT|nr:MULTISPECIES: 6-carboxytetrahydropterin synthase QueD [Nitrosomonas]AKH38179.1 6-carboxy-5,6,7,8-tetrahydropterin synthase [Nitrosomonas communis]TYP91139.1 6-pyruvoyltetrahydropterin/6-carboxytetrahydropterin synthase [Nitrosomonas communis]UVS60142.1 6-carboxytetrahydropterin synthase QueD [Nitrosomonas sp. PLL12]